METLGPTSHMKRNHLTSMIETFHANSIGGQTNSKTLLKDTIEKKIKDDYSDQYKKKYPYPNVPESTIRLYLDKVTGRIFLMYSNQY